MLGSVQAAEEIREGLVRLVTDVEHPLGRGGPEENPLCAAFRGSQIRSLAVVGNGPIDEAQRQEIDTFDMVVRCALGGKGGASACFENPPVRGMHTQSACIASFVCVHCPPSTTARLSAVSGDTCERHTCTACTDGRRCLRAWPIMAGQHGY